jgi:hypothetical protein
MASEIHHIPQEQRHHHTTIMVVELTISELPPLEEEALDSKLSLRAEAGAAADGPIGISSSAFLIGKGPLFAPRGEKGASSGACWGVYSSVGF